jgi:hypothetical protein
METVSPNVAKAGALRSRGEKDEAVVLYCEPLTTIALECSGFPEGEKHGEYRRSAKSSQAAASRLWPNSDAPLLRWILWLWQGGETAFGAAINGS